MAELAPSYGSLWHDEQDIQVQSCEKLSFSFAHREVNAEGKFVGGMGEFITNPNFKKTGLFDRCRHHPSNPRLGPLRAVVDGFTWTPGQLAPKEGQNGQDAVSTISWSGGNTRISAFGISMAGLTHVKVEVVLMDGAVVVLPCGKYDKGLTYYANGRNIHKINFIRSVKSSQESVWIHDLHLWIASSPDGQASSLVVSNPTCKEMFGSFAQSNAVAATLASLSESIKGSEMHFADEKQGPAKWLAGLATISRTLDTALVQVHVRSNKNVVKGTGVLVSPLRSDWGSRTYVLMPNTAIFPSGVHLTPGKSADEERYDFIDELMGLDKKVEDAAEKNVKVWVGDVQYKFHMSYFFFIPEFGMMLAAITPVINPASLSASAPTSARAATVAGPTHVSFAARSHLANGERANLVYRDDSGHLRLSVGGFSMSLTEAFKMKPNLLKPKEKEVEVEKPKSGSDNAMTDETDSKSPAVLSVLKETPSSFIAPMYDDNWRCVGFDLGKTQVSMLDLCEYLEFHRRDTLAELVKS